MYYVDTKPAPCHLHTSDFGDRRARRRLRQALRRLAQALGGTGHRAWEQRRFAGLARLSATAGWTGRRALSQPGTREVAEAKESDPKVA